jgi:hypothetical protein
MVAERHFMNLYRWESFAKALAKRRQRLESEMDASRRQLGDRGEDLSPVTANVDAIGIAAQDSLHDRQRLSIILKRLPGVGTPDAGTLRPDAASDTFDRRARNRSFDP